jgi:hypothetical protein
MDNINDLISKIKDDNNHVSTLLKEAKFIIGEIDETNSMGWINLELSGYGDKQIPKYRIVRGQMKGWNPYYGWVPVAHKNTEIEIKLCNRGTGQSVREIEELLKSDSDSFEMPYPASIANEILEGSLKTKVSLFISRSSLAGILETVRNRLFDLAIQINKEKKESVLGVGELKKKVGGLRLPGGIAIGPLMFSKDGKTANTIMGPAIIPFDYGITNSLNLLNKTELSIEEFQATFNSQVEDLVAEMLIYFQNRLKPISQSNVGQFNSVNKCVAEYKKHSINLEEFCDVNFLLDVDNVRGRKHHSDRRYDSNYEIGNIRYDTVEKLRELNRKIHEQIHMINDKLAETHKDYDVKVTQTPNSTTIEFTAASHAFDLTKGGKVVSKKKKVKDNKSINKP